MIEIEFHGKVCPAATSDVCAAPGCLPPGEILVVISDYLPAWQTVAALARQFDCQAEVRDEGAGRFTIGRVVSLSSTVWAWLLYVIIGVTFLYLHVLLKIVDAPRGVVAPMYKKEMP